MAIYSISRRVNKCRSIPLKVKKVLVQEVRVYKSKTGSILWVYTLNMIFSYFISHGLACNVAVLVKLIAKLEYNTKSDKAHLR